MVNRRDFLKTVGLVAGGVALVNSPLYKLLEKTDGKEKIETKFSLGGYIGLYPMLPWVLTNEVVARQRLNGLVIGAQQTLSLDNILFPNDEILYNNLDPKKGLVSGPTLNPLDRAAADGVCKVATDMFRAVMKSSLLVGESTSHYQVARNHPYFNDNSFPYGTDAAVYVDPENGIKHDLTVVNPWNFPVKINYDLYSKDGKKVNYGSVLDKKIRFSDDLFGLWQKAINEGKWETGVTIGDGIIPASLAINNIYSVVGFSPVDENQKVLPWSTKLAYQPIDGGKNVSMVRELTVDNKIVNKYVRDSVYVK